VTSRPNYFDNIRVRAEKRWDQLENDPELAGPWHQLFKQVQSPRHILSELLQNADDAGASEASVHIENNSFIFTHNGEDFTDEHFASLCRFGYSNKRALHTIGFRGIGFKSTFSLGDTVELYTPTLSVSFNRRRFTEPIWLASSEEHAGRTKIRVAISDDHRQRDVEKNLLEWLKSPVSLLFFKHIRRLQIGDQQVHWDSLGPGPIPETEWMTILEDQEKSFLIARSGYEPFPSDALHEIRQERMFDDSQDSDFPPCKVEIVLGAKGRLYVVLPTGVETALPFACNAPFIQDPARLKIKDPETSPTNRWLLGRIGTLAASVMLQWLEQTSQSLIDRSCAYGFFPDVDRDDNSLDGACAAIVEEAFEAAIKDKAFLLTNYSELKKSGQSVVIPEELFDVWPAEQVSTLLDGANRPAFSRKVSGADVEKLRNWGVIEKIEKDDVLSILEKNHLPKPEAWRSLLNLWSYVAPEITGYKHHLSEESIRIFPVQGKEVLYSASEVVRLGEKKLLKTDADWDFLAAHLLVLNQNWPRFLADQRRDAAENKDKNLQVRVDAAYAIFDSVNLEDASDVSTVIGQVALDYFSGKESILLSSCIQLAQIASKLGATTDESFRFATKDLNLQKVKHAVLFDADGTLESIFTEKWCLTHLLHPDYAKSFDSCTSDEWNVWITSGRAGLHTFAPLVQTQSKNWRKQSVNTELLKRGFKGTPYFPYVTSSFQFEDWDFESVHWIHWETLAEQDDSFWARLVSHILGQPEAYWSKAKNARIFQVATTGNKRAITNEPLLPAWILKLRDLPCLSDTRGFYHKPADLLRRTPETESLMDVEPFIHGRLDTETTRPLLRMLGVRDTPTGPDRLLDCLRALSKASTPPAHEVDKWYRRLDQMIETCSTVDFANIKKSLLEEKIVLTEECGWSSGSGVFLSSDEEDVPGAAVIRASCRDLTLWRKIGIADRPTSDLAIQWLMELPSGKPLSQEDSRRVQYLLKRHAVRIWNECGHWLNLAGEWAPVDTLDYALSMQTLIPWAHLHGWIKQKTADFQRLPTEISNVSPFSDLPHLGDLIKDRFISNLIFMGQPDTEYWLNQLGAELSRIVLEDEAETERIRRLASDLSETTKQIVPGLELVPYIDGTPAGTARRADVVWLDKVLYVDRLPNAKLARIVPDRLGKIFGRTDIAAAMNYCFERSTREITEYIEENFKLVPRDVYIVDHVDLATSVGESCSVDDEVGQLPSSKLIAENAGMDAVIEEDNTQSDSEVESAKVIDENELDNEEVTLPKVPIIPKPAKPKIIERFARNLGFLKDGEDRFYHPDGSWLAKTHGASFPWERRTATGDIVCYYWPKEHCLETEPLQLDADVWGLIDKFPKTYALVLSNLEGEPLEVSGTNLRAMRDEAKLTLYPATYRLVIDHDHK